jgi:MFS family permease
VPDPQIGVIVGAAALIQIPAAFLAGVVVDRIGGVRAFTWAALAYLAGSLILLAPGVEPGGPPWPFLAARLFQGVGIAAALPAALSLVPRLVTAARRGFGLAFISSAHNLALVVFPPLSLVVLTATSLHGVAVVAIVSILAGLVALRIAPLPFRPDDEAATEDGPAVAARRRLGFAFRRAWASPIAIELLYIVHWGVVIAFLPQRAEAAGADPGLFFVADGIAILLSRVPTGWLVDRVRPIIPMGIGLLAATGAILLLTLPPTTPILVLAGTLSGASGGLVITPVIVELSRRSAAADRGSAFSLFSAANATALAIGSIGGALVVSLAGFPFAMLLTLAGILAAAVLVTLDRDLAQVRRPEQEPEPAVDLGP